MAFLGSAPGGSRLTDFGQSLGTGLGRGLNALANAKLESLEQAQAEREFERSGYPKEHARLFARYRNHPKILDFLQKYEREDEGEQPYQVKERNYLEEFQHPNINQQQEFYNRPEQIPQQDNLEQIFRSLSSPQGLLQAQAGKIPNFPTSYPETAQGQRGQSLIEQSEQESSRLPLQPTPSEKRIKPPSFKKTTSLADELTRERIQSSINASNKSYTDSLDKRVTSLNEALPIIEEMEQLLQSGNVQSGAFAGLIPAQLRGQLLNEDSQRFATLGDSLAVALTGLQSGIQTISKINFNTRRKPNLSMSHGAQIESTKDAANQLANLALEADIENYIIQKNGGQPHNLSTKVRSEYNKLSNNIPDIPNNAQQGQTFTDPETKARWQVQGPIMRFIGFKGK